MLFITVDFKLTGVKILFINENKKKEIFLEKVFLHFELVLRYQLLVIY